MATGSPSGAPERVRRWIPWAALAAGAALPLARVLLSPLDRVPGLATGDVYKHVWPYWHTLAQLGEGGWPRTPYLAAPDGGVLLDVMLLPALVMAPLTALAGPVASANAWVWATLLAGGGATYALARRLGGSTSGALAAGLLVQTAPAVIGYGLASGVHERLAVWVFPLLLLALLRTRDVGGWRWPAVATATLAFAALHCSNYGLFACVMTAFALPWLAWPRRGERRWSASRRLAPALIGMALVLVGAVLLLRWLIPQPDFLADVGMQRVELRTGERAVYEAATLGDLLGPARVRSTPPSRYEDEIYFMPYLGWVPLLALAAGLAVCARTRRWRALAAGAIGVGFGVLALGPVIRPSVEQAGLSNPLFAAVRALVPFYGQTPGIWQQVGLTVTLGGAAIAVGIGALPGRRLRWIAAAVLVAAALAERAWVLPVSPIVPAADARVADVYRAAAPDGVLAEVPRLWRGEHLTPGPAFLAQTVHHRPLTMAIDYGLSDWDGVRVLMDCRAQLFEMSVGCLRSGGIRWVAVHRDWFADPDHGVLCARSFEMVVGAPTADDGTVALFDLARLPGEPPEALCAHNLERESTVQFQDRDVRDGHVAPVNAGGTAPDSPAFPRPR